MWHNTALDIADTHPNDDVPNIPVLTESQKEENESIKEERCKATNHYIKDIARSRPAIPDQKLTGLNLVMMSMQTWQVYLLDNLHMWVVAIMQMW